MIWTRSNRVWRSAVLPSCVLVHDIMQIQLFYTVNLSIFSNLLIFLFNSWSYFTTNAAQLKHIRVVRCPLFRVARFQIFSFATVCHIHFYLVWRHFSHQVVFQNCKSLWRWCDIMPYMNQVIVILDCFLEFASIITISICSLNSTHFTVISNIHLVWQRIGLPRTWTLDPCKE